MDHQASMRLDDDAYSSVKGPIEESLTRPQRSLRSELTQRVSWTVWAAAPHCNGCFLRRAQADGGGMAIALAASE